MNTNNFKSPLSKSDMELYEIIQRIGKGKRKFQLSISKWHKKLLYNTLKSLNTLLRGNSKTDNIIFFTKYIENDIKSKSSLKVSYDEVIFLRKIISITIKELETQKFRWYQFFKKLYSISLLSQYKNILKTLNG